MTPDRDDRLDLSRSSPLPETPHELPFNRAAVDTLVDRVRAGGRANLLEAILDAIDWSSFATADGAPLAEHDRAELRDYYRQKWSDVGPLFLAELLSTEFITEQRARGDILFSERLLLLGRNEPELWHEIRQFFRRKEMVTALLAAGHDPRAGGLLVTDDEEEDLWE
jgi:hypothetical protein